MTFLMFVLSSVFPLETAIDARTRDASRCVELVCNQLVTSHIFLLFYAIHIAEKTKKYLNMAVEKYKVVNGSCHCQGHNSNPHGVNNIRFDGAINKDAVANEIVVIEVT